MRRITACFALMGLLVSPPAWVHHSGAMFDKTRTVEVSGVVKEFAWTNPHSSFKVEDGDAKLWAIEMNGTSNLVHEGWKRNTIKPGDKVTVTINPLRDGRPGGWFVAIKLPDGSMLGSVGGAGAAALSAPGASAASRALGASAASPALSVPAALGASAASARSASGTL